MKKKYIPVREVFIFLAMLVFLLNYLEQKKDRQEIEVKAGVRTEEDSQYGVGEETEEQNPDRESAGTGEQSPEEDLNVETAQAREEDLDVEAAEAKEQGQSEENGQTDGKTLSDWKKEIEKQVPSQEQAGEEKPDVDSTEAEEQSPDVESAGAGGGTAQDGEGNVYTGAAETSGTNPQNVGQAPIPADTIQEEDIYSFLQGPGSWGERRSWSGEWCEFEIDGNRFGGFGCGLCCMTNVYDTLSPYEVSPWDMFENARVASDYSPGGEYGAIDWQEMRCTLDVCGISGELHRKPDTFEEFRAQVRGALSAIVLVSNGNEDTYWPNTKGHYVNIWLYERDDTIFLAEPGNPGRNRTRIPLRHIYDSLKMGSSYQYLLVTGYSEEENRWRASGISENWCRP